MLVMTQEAPIFAERHELRQATEDIRWATPEQARGAVAMQAADEVTGWRQAVAASGGRMATAAELDQAGL